MTVNIKDNLDITNCEIYLTEIFGKYYTSESSKKEIDSAIKNDVCALLLYNVTSKIIEKFREEHTSNIKSQFYLKDDIGLENLYELMDIVDSDKSDAIRDKFSEELNFKWEIPKILLPLYAYIYLNSAVDKNIYTIHKKDLGNLKLGIRYLEKTSSKVSDKKLIDMYINIEKFIQILNTKGYINGSLNLIYFNMITGLYNLKIYSNQIFQQNYQMQIKKMGINYIELTKKDRLDSIKGIVDNCYYKTFTLPLGIQLEIIKLETNPTFSEREELDSEKYLNLLTYLTAKLESEILNDYKGNESEIERAYFIYQKLCKAEFYEKNIRKFSKENIYDLKDRENSDEEKIEELLYFDTYYGTAQVIYDNNIEED